ncbi:hypothetical protein [Mucilaginibacter sp. KACC 22063]|uniref:hypothetical protein n=1 Tax=Mucilaginibacter sp. KACC 22063 TaxID=3025666 RepID=UPI0023651FCB|nr:hypothetical protein [Mucilaginibacter sp. KACC 22063]WDF57258.1 hypothetical protein PQ461_09355 [Mucilaginibacter sp. KACC 22063]
MSEIETGPGTIGVGLIRFYDSIQPPLPAGNYTLQATQVVKGVTDKDDPQYQAEQKLLVNGPRFSIDAASIHSLYPPANQTGTYDNSLPNVVFNNFSLPWSREIDPTDGSNQQVDAPAAINQIPWMGLLTIYAADMEGTTPFVGRPFSTTVTQFQQAPANVLLPVLGSITNPDEALNAVDINLAYFQSIAPTITELPMLAHARQVNTGGKVMLGMNDDGCFSVLIGNRLPGAGMKNLVFMVSYEGHQSHLNGAVIPGGYDTIRLVLLGSWEFTGSASIGSFKTLMADLCDPGRGGVDLLQMPMADATAQNELAKEALEISYIPLQNAMRDGERSTSWYRGPMVAAPTRRDFSYGPYLYSDHAMQYDPEFGLFNHAYSAAWQIGRLLALSDASFASGLFAWRNKYLASITKIAKNEEVKQKAQVFGLSARNEEFDIVSGMMSLFSDKFSKVDWPQFRTRAELAPAEYLTGKLQEDEIQALLESDEDPLLELKKKINGR